MVRVVLDTNVLISALVYGGKPRDVLELFISGELEIVICEELLTELRRTIRDKFVEFKSETVKLEYLLRRDTLMVPLGTLTIKAARDNDDNYILEMAIISQSDYIISGDKDLLSLKNFRGVNICNPADFIKLFK